MRFTNSLAGPAIAFLTALALMGLAWDNPTLPAKELPLIAAVAMMALAGLPLVLGMLEIMFPEKDVVIDRSVEPSLNPQPALPKLVRTAPPVSLGFRPPVLPAIAAE